MKAQPIVLLTLLFSLIFGSAIAGEAEIKLPAPVTDGQISLEKAMEQRRSVRSYAEGPLSMEELSQLLWAAQGVTRRMERPRRWFQDRKWIGGLRTAPSAGALYPLEVYVAAGEVTGLEKGLYKYLAMEHSLVRKGSEDLRGELAAASLGQSYVKDCAVDIIITAVYARVESKYGNRAEIYVPIEVGAAMQNIYLQCESLKLGTVVIGAFRDNEVEDVLDLPDRERPIAIMPVGRKTRE
ncbi:MAG: SagB/ThcOx family dehydrogenase [Candidatus Latescibacteria bacterium]|nr:SagB/ThcOx family dehydrogenase [bacterium]MBD3424721.1 SagB/ThcOx family dehydrogenase [Candidatus Latescibacterota bacterium]